MFRKGLKATPEKMEHIAKIDNSRTITDKSLMIRSVMTILFVILGFITHDMTHIPAYVFAVSGAAFLLLFEKPKEIYRDVEWLTIFFFVGLFIIIGAGHNAKAMAMAYMAPVIAGVLLTYKGKYLWGWLLTAFALAFEVRTNHLQITYYLALIIVILVIAELISDLKNKKLGHFIKASIGLAVAAIIGILTCSTALYGNYEFGKETTRGKPVLTRNEDNQTKGLDRDYITQWSYGKGETWSLLIPNAKGGASAYIGKKNPALDKADRQFRESIAQSSAYWGDQPGTSGPVYVGAIVVFLFVLGALTVKGKLKWALLIATLLSILLSWGKNFMGFTNFFLDYVPMYDKFRTVASILVIAEFTIPLLAMLALKQMAEGTLKRIPQDHSRMTYDPMLRKEMGVIDFRKEARLVRGQINGLNPWPCASVLFDGQRIKLLRAAAAEESGIPGTVLYADPKKGLAIACGTGSVRILELQAPGGKPMRAEDYLRGHAIPAGADLNEETV